MKQKYILTAIVILFVTVIFFFHKIIFTDLTYFQRDVILQFKPWKIYINKTFAQIKNPNTNYLDFIPLWNPYNHCGAPFMANLQSQVFYPFSIIFYLVQDFATAYKIFIILHFFLSAVFMFLLLKKKNLSFIPAMAGSILWSFNGFMISRIEFLSVFATIIWLPLIIFLFDSIDKVLDIKKVIVLGLFIAIQFLAGHAQMWVYSIIFLICYSFYRSYKFKTFTPLFSCILSIIISIFLAAIQFLPTAEFFFHSVRAGEGIKQFGMNYDQAVYGSLKLHDLLNFFYPFYWQFNLSNLTPDTKILNIKHYWLYTFYIGFVGCLLTILEFSKINKQKSEKIFYLIISIITILYALGENFIVYDLFYKYVPFIRIFRHPSVAVYIAVFIFCIFAAEGLQFIRQIFKKYKYHKVFLTLITFLCLLELFFYNEKITMLLPKPILDEKGELINFMLNKAKQDTTYYRFAHTPLTQKLATTTSGKTLYETIAKYRDKMFNNINLEYGLYNFRGQDIELSNYYKFMDFTYNRKSLDEAIPFFSIANTKYILSILYQKTSVTKLIKDGEIKVYENPTTLSLLYPVKKVVFEPDLNKALNMLENLKFELLTTAVVHSKKFIESTSSENTNPCFTIHRLEIKPNKIFSIVSVSTPTFLVFSQNYYPGWYCKVDNQKTKIYHCNIFMRGIFLKEGTHQICFYYDPYSFKIGCVTTLASLFFCMFYLLEKTTKQGGF